MLDHYGDQRAVQQATAGKATERSRAERTEAQKHIAQDIEAFKANVKDRELINDQSESSGMSL